MTTMIPAETSSRLHETRLLIDRLVCEFSSFVNVERLKERPNTYLLAEWECHLLELHRDRALLSESPSIEQQIDLVRHARALGLKQAREAAIRSTATPQITRHADLSLTGMLAGQPSQLLSSQATIRKSQELRRQSACQAQRYHLAFADLCDVIRTLPLFEVATAVLPSTPNGGL